MTILTALANLYPRLVDEGRAPPRGFSEERIGGEVLLNADGTVKNIRSLLVADEKGKMRPVPRYVPAAFKRASGIKPNLLWDKTAYALGVIATENEDGAMVAGQGKRTMDEHEAFKADNLALLADSDDEGLRALRLFLEHWTPAQFDDRGFDANLLDQNFVFRLEGDERRRFIHERRDAVALINRQASGADGALCLVTGDRAPPARLHPSIKGVMGAQAAGASLVSFNDAAYESFGNKQGANAPVSEPAAAAYGATLNTLLARGSRQVTRIGDATVVFWANADDGDEARAAELTMESALARMEAAEDDDENAANINELKVALDRIGKGQPSPELNLNPATRVFILGLAPNAARLSVRFWVPGTFGDFARNVTAFWNDLQIEPAAWDLPPKAGSVLYETARITTDANNRRKHHADTIPDKLGGELMRAVLADQPFPRTLLAAIIERIRSDGQITARRAAICKAYLARQARLAGKRRGDTEPQEDMLVALDETNQDPAYRLGRLFAVLEQIQMRALPGLNATIKDRYFASASATPARVFPIIVRNANHHLGNLRKSENSGLAFWLDKQMGEIWLGIEPELPRSLNLEQQGRFVAGYYHQRWTPRDKKNGENGAAPDEEDTQ